MKCLPAWWKRVSPGDKVMIKAFLVTLTILAILIAAGGGCSSPLPPSPKVKTPGHTEERYYLGAKKNKFILTITIYDVHSPTDYRQEAIIQRHFDTYEQMIQEIKNRKEAISK